MRRLLRGLFDGGDDSGEERAPSEFVRRYDLTAVDWSDYWERIYIDPQDKAKLVNYGLLE